MCSSSACYIPGMFWTNLTNLSLKMGPSRPWKHRVCCLLLNQLMIRFLSVLLNCFMLPPGDDNFPCCCKLHFSKLFNESKLLVQVNQSPFNWRCFKSELSRLGKNRQSRTTCSYFCSREIKNRNGLTCNPDKTEEDHLCSCFQSITLPGIDWCWWLY